MSDNRKPEWQLPKGVGFPKELADRVEALALKNKWTFSQTVRELVEHALKTFK
jgi:predicted DNA-binding protein